MLSNCKSLSIYGEICSKIANLKISLLHVTGKRVIHSHLTQKKLVEVKKALDIDTMVM